MANMLPENSIAAPKITKINIESTDHNLML